MLHLLDESLENMLRADMRLAKNDVDVAFNAPDNEWAARITKPTLNLFLWDIRLSGDETQAGRERVVRDGKDVWRARPPRVSFSYLLTAWTNDARDEHRLLGQALTALLASPELADQHLAEGLEATEPPPSIKVARPDAKDFADFWSAIDGQLKPGLDVTITATVDPGVVKEAGPPTEEFVTEVTDRREPERRSTRRRFAGHIDDPAAHGAAVTSPRGKATVSNSGDFLVPAEAGDTVTVHLDEPVRLVVGAVEEDGAGVPG